MHQQSSFQDTSGWKLDLIARRARRKGLRGQDVDDAVQELALDVLDFDFDRQRANGAEEAAVLSSLIDRRLSSHLRAQQRYRRHLAHIAATQGDNAEIDESQDLSATDAALDIETVVASLPACQQEVCRRLMVGESVNEIAETLGCSWHTIRRAMDDIRATFISVGLDR